MNSEPLPTLGTKLLDNIRRNPDAMAIESHGQQYSWRFVESVVENLAQTLDTLGVKPEERVGFIAHTRATHIAALWLSLIHI